MEKPQIQSSVTLQTLLPIPSWILSGPAESLNAAAFRSGAALAHLTLVTKVADLPSALWRDRLALAAAEVCVGLAGRREGAAALRDAVHLTRSGDDPGPAGKVLRQWSQAVARPISVAGLAKVLEGVAAERIALCLDAGGPTPVERVAGVIEAVLTDSPRAETAALILADAVLAQSLGWTHVLPLLSLSLKPRDLRRRGDDLRLACHRCAADGAGQAVPMAADLARAAARLRAVVPKLRARTAVQAVDLFLTRDALAPSALDFMSDRAARRLCDRLVDLGALRELTGRDTFRLYGI
jgi:Protein of unknown function (DUF1403)